MNLLISLAVGILFGTGVYLMLKRDLIRVVAGVIIISNAANLFIIGAGLFLGGAPIISEAPEEIQVSDPLVQALVLTAIVISFGVSALVQAMVYRIYTTHHTLDQDDLRKAEREETDELKRSGEVS